MTVSGTHAETAIEIGAHILARDFRGYDPYDALTSPLFRLPVLRSNRRIRWAAQQLVKRSPLNARRVLHIPEGRNPVTLGLAIQGFAHLARASPAQRADYGRIAGRCVSELERLVSPGYSGACWGYDFDWQSRYASIPAQTPTIVATGVITNGLYAAFEEFQLKEALDLCSSACDFVLNDLHRTERDGVFCWSYSPLDRTTVLNATVKGSRLCAQVHVATSRPQLKDAALRSLGYAVEHQAPSGAFPYAVNDRRTWSDNYHTGYVLDCLHECGERLSDVGVAEAAERGWSYYRKQFFVSDQIPKAYDSRLYPIDCTGCAQSILTLTRFGDLHTAERVANWTIEHMQRPDGGFRYQLRRHYTIGIPYMRWSTAWMFSGLSYLAAALVVSNRQVRSRNVRHQSSRPSNA